MFIGHYAPALIAKRWAPHTSLGWMFLAVQFLDVVWAPFVLLGVENARVKPGYLPASALELYHMPWTHSLLLAAIWSYLIYRLFNVAALGWCVLSHWLLDLVAHAPDLPLYPGGPAFGFGLWRWRDATAATEVVLMLAGLWIYMSGTRPKSSAGSYLVPVFVLLLIAIALLNLYGPGPTDINGVAVAGEVSYLVFALLAGWFDRYRYPAR